MTTAKEDQMRAEFELWGKSVFCGYDWTFIEWYSYDNNKLASAFEAYKACAESYEKKLAEKDASIDERNVDYAGAMYELREANARNAMLVEALETVKFTLSEEHGGDHHEDECPYCQSVVIVDKANYANSEAVAAYEREVAAKALEKAASEFSDDEYREITYGAVYRKLIRMAEELKTNKVKNDRNNRSSKTQHNITS